MVQRLAGGILTSDGVRKTPYAECRMSYAAHQDTWPTEKMISHQFESLLQQSRICHVPFFFFSVGDLTMIPMYCLLSVHPETSLSQQRSTPIQISDALPRGHDPIAHARRARYLAHVRSIFNECAIVIVIVFSISLNCLKCGSCPDWFV